MNHFTSKYKEVKKLEGIPFNVSIHHEDHSRWICYTYKESIGKNGFQITMVDNYLELYIVNWSGPGSKELTSNNNNKVSVNSDNNYRMDEVITNSITCKAFYTESVPLPDFAIDVLQTIQTPILYEVLRRVAVSFHQKITPTNNLNRFDNSFISYPFGNMSIN
jgi:hypothetical protein